MALLEKSPENLGWQALFEEEAQRWGVDQDPILLRIIQQLKEVLLSQPTTTPIQDAQIISVGKGSTAVSPRGVHVGGMVHGSIVTGDIHGQSIGIGGTITQITPFRLDTALPSQVQRGRTFELAVAIRQLTSPVLKEDDLDQTKSGDVQVDWPEEANSIALRIHVSAQECTIQQDSYPFRLYKGQDSRPFYFQLTPQQAGRIGIIVTVYQEADSLGGARVYTVVQEQLVGKVEVQVVSQPLGPTLEAKVRVARHIEQLFTTGQLHTLCFDLGVVFDNLEGSTLAEKARSLVTDRVNNGRFLELLHQCQEQRSNVDWYALAVCRRSAGLLQ